MGMKCLPFEYYDRIFNGGWGMRFDRTDGYYTVQSPWEGRAHVYTSEAVQICLFGDWYNFRNCSMQRCIIKQME